MITIYTKPDCPKCVATKKAFERNGIQFQTIDISEHGNGHFVEYIKRKLGYSSLPAVEVTDVTGKTVDKWCSYRPDKINEWRGAA